MITIAEAISDLLFVRDTVVVPGLGAFVKKPVSAKVNPVAHYFTMPSSVIEFDPNLREDNELVVRYLSEKNEIPEDEAKKLLAMFVSDCFNSLKTKKKVVLNGVGALSYDWADDLVFEPDKTVNYNSDAFGLSDFTTQAVLRSKTKEEIKSEIEQQQKDKNTPVTVDEKAVHEYVDNEDDEPRRLGWLWALLGLLLLAGVVFGLHYFKVVDWRFWQHEPQRVVDSDAELPTLVVPSYHWDWQALLEQKNNETIESQPDTDIQEPVVEQATVESPAELSPEANIRIIAGCFAQEENAARLANTLKDKGFGGAFYEKRRDKWFVSFGRYATDEEATAALRDIRKNTEYKAWILK